MSLARIIASSLEAEGVTFKKAGKKISSHDVQEILKNVVARELLTWPQGGIKNDEYFCDKCADKVKSG